MAYIKPINSHKTKRQKHLNISNTDHYNNYKCITNAQLNNYIQLVPASFNKYYNHIMSKARYGMVVDDNTYLYQQSSMIDEREDKVIELIETGVHFIYRTNFVASDRVIDALAENDNSSFMFSLDSNPRQAKIVNIIKAFEATKVIAETPIVLPDISTYSLLTALSSLKTNIDEVQLDFTALHKKEFEAGVVDRGACYYVASDGLYHPYPNRIYDYYKNIEPGLSNWKMYITIIVNNDEDKSALDKLEKG